MSTTDAADDDWVDEWGEEPVSGPPPVLADMAARRLAESIDNLLRMSPLGFPITKELYEDDVIHAHLLPRWEDLLRVSEKEQADERN